MREKSTCVIGNAGYVGSVLVPVLRQNGMTVFGYDTMWFGSNLASEIPPQFDVETQVKEDIRRPLEIEAFGECDSIIYLAAISNDPMGRRFEVITDDINAQACIETAEAAKARGVRRFIFASSCSMYGNASGEPKREEDELNPLTAYARSKVRAEQVLSEMSTDKFQVTCLRFATACGASPRLRLDLVLNDFVASAVTSGYVEVLSDGSPWRPLIHVKDMARAIQWALERDTGGDYLAVNIGSDEWTYSIGSLAMEVQKVIDDCQVMINSSAAPDKRSYKVDFSLFQRLAPEYQPTVSIEEAIQGLAAQMGTIKLGKGDFRSSPKWSRLNTLEAHIASGRLDTRLFWKV